MDKIDELYEIGYKKAKREISNIKKIIVNDYKIINNDIFFKSWKYLKKI